tara:strand:+ start:1248 stop:1769 length:522 start_codon:yes stop_codon:yes gene_type:complete
MDEIIKKSESIDLTGDNVRNICEGEVEIVPYHTLGQYSSIENLLEKHGAVILLYETRENFGHYVALFYNKDGDLEFFDSYGFKPDQELKYATFNLNNGKPFLTLLLEKYNKKLIVNTKRLQIFLKDINTCGRWTSLRVRFRKKYNLREFIHLTMDNKNYNGDFWVSALTYLLI